MATSSAIRRAFDARLTGLGVNLSEATVLAYVKESGFLSQTKIAEGLGRGRASTGVVIDGLHDKGLVERRADVDDRRVWLVGLTAEGASLSSAIEAADLRLRSEIRAGFTRAERRQLAGMLLRLQKNLTGILDERPFE